MPAVLLCVSERTNSGPQLLCQETLPIEPSHELLFSFIFLQNTFEILYLFCISRSVGIHFLQPRVLTENKYNCWGGGHVKKSLGPGVPSSYNERTLFIKTAEALGPDFFAPEIRRLVPVVTIFPCPACLPVSINLFLKQTFLYIKQKPELTHVPTTPTQ